MVRWKYYGDILAYYFSRSMNFFSLYSLEKRTIVNMRAINTINRRHNDNLPFCDFDEEEGKI